MKVKRYCPDGEEYGCGECKEVEIEISTDAMIKELNRIRPCIRCVNGPVSEYGSSCQCLWADIFYGYNDNFKEAKP